MNTIRFSHEYPKLHGQTSAVRLCVKARKVLGARAEARTKGRM